MGNLPVATNVVIAPSEPDIGEDDITGTYQMSISAGCGDDVSTYAYVSSKGNGTILQSGQIVTSGVIPAYTPIPSDNQADIVVEVRPLTTCGQTGVVKVSNTVTPANNP